MADFLEFSGPLKGGETVTKSDTVDLTNVCRALWVGTAGNVVIVTPYGDTLTLNNVQDGTLLPVTVKRVNSTNTTASNMVGLW